MNKRKLFCLGLALIFSVSIHAMDTEPQEKADTTTKDQESFEEMWARWQEGRLNSEAEGQAFQEDLQESISFAFKINNPTPAQVDLKKKLLGYTQHCKKDRLERYSLSVMHIYITCYKKSFSAGIHAIDTKPQKKADTTAKDPESFEEMWARLRDGRFNEEEDDAFEKDYQKSISFSLKVNNATPAQINLKKKLLGYTQHCKKGRLEKLDFRKTRIYINCYEKPLKSYWWF